MRIARLKCAFGQVGSAKYMNALICIIHGGEADGIVRDLKLELAVGNRSLAPATAWYPALPSLPVIRVGECGAGRHPVPARCG